MRRTQQEVKAELFSRFETEKKIRKRRKIVRTSVICTLCLCMAFPITMLFRTTPEEPPAVEAIYSKDLMEGIEVGVVNGREADEVFVSGQMEFAVRFLQAACSEKKDVNILLSPTSAELCLAMVANGADGNTLQQMEYVMANGLPISVLNEYLYSQVQALPSSEQCNLSVNNALWVNEDIFVPNDTFLSVNKTNFNSAAYKAPFNSITLNEINDWASINTNGNIPLIFEKLDPNSAMALVNTVWFDAQWKRNYDASDVLKDRIFRSYDGTEQNVNMLFSSESVYLSDGTLAQGFLKPYANERYAFCALLPEEGTDIFEYVGGLTSERLMQIFKTKDETEEFTVQIPEFDSRCGSDIKTLLSSMGMPDAFLEGKANFGLMSDGEKNDLFIEQIVHNAIFKVSRYGTQATAATGTEVSPTPVFEKKIILDRPFVYMILDTQTNLPLFIGVQISCK